MTAAAPELAARLRLITLRLARRLRLRDPSITATKLSALVVVERHGSMRMSDLARYEGISAATVSKLVDALVAHGLLGRTSDPDDGRSLRVEVTEAGAAVVADYRRRGTEQLLQALRTLDGDDLATLTRAVDVLDRLERAMGDGAERAVPPRRAAAASRA